MKRTAKVLVVVAVLAACSAMMAATIRPGGDPAKARVIWADPFDYYNQWAWDNRDNPAYSRGTTWQGGPIPAGDPAGGYPTKAPSGGCDTVIQTVPARHEMARAQWLGNDCPVIISPRGIAAAPASFDANMDPKCGGSGETVSTRGQFGWLNYTWGMGGSYTSMPQFSHSFGDRLQEIAAFRGEGLKNAVNGTDANPLTVIFYLHTGTAGFHVFDNAYVELSLGDETAPTDYIWRGNWEADDPPGEYCPQGPYPIVCQQAREVNTSVSEDGSDLAYLNDHCPPLVQPYDPETGTGKTWRSLAFGLLAIVDKDPCGVDEQGVDAHKPTSDHFVVFDGNKWRQLRSSRYPGLEGPFPLGFPYEANMQKAASDACNDFTLSVKDSKVYLKIMTDDMLIYVENPAGIWHAAVPRVYKGPFDTIRIGVGPGCELDPATGECKESGTPYQCLTYSGTQNVGYNRVQIESMSILDGELAYADLISGACCEPDGDCIVTDQLSCQTAGGRWDGVGSACGDVRCCPVQYGDTDKDFDVDQLDFALLQRCITTGDGALQPECKCLDTEPNGTIDATDIERFALCGSGPDVPADPGCKNW